MHPEAAFLIQRKLNQARIACADAKRSCAELPCPYFYSINQFFRNASTPVFRLTAIFFSSASLATRVSIAIANVTIQLTRQRITLQGEFSLPQMTLVVRALHGFTEEVCL